MSDTKEEKWQDYVDSLVDEGELSINEVLFVNEYINNNFNASTAYMNSYGCSNKDVANAQAHLVMKRPHVKDAIKHALRLRMQARRATNDAIEAKFASIAFSEPEELFNPDGSIKNHKYVSREVTDVHGEGDKHASYVETEVNINTITAAARELAKIKKMYNERKELELMGSVDIEGGFDKAIEMMAAAISKTESLKVDDNNDGVLVEED